jgi:hypothetical protein
MNILWQLWISLCFSYVRAAKLLLYLCEIITFFRGKKNTKLEPCYLVGSNLAIEFFAFTRICGKIMADIE